MGKVKLREMSVENYKKFGSASFQFAPRTMVSGRNQQGKTSLMDAYFDVLTKKLANGLSPDNVRSKVDGVEVEAPVEREITLLIDGVETVIHKETKKSTAKYIVDGFKYGTLTKFDEFLKERIAPPETIALCSSAGVFLNILRKSSVDARQKLEEMSGFSLSEFVKEHPEYSEAYGFTKGNPIEETFKKLGRELKAIKANADEVEKEVVKASRTEVAKPEQDLEELRNRLLSEMEEVVQEEQQLNDSSKAYDELSYEITGLKKSRDALVLAAGEEHQKEKVKITNELFELREKKRTQESILSSLEISLKSYDSMEEIEKKISLLKKQYADTYALEWDDTELKNIQSEVFDPESAICPTCGQNLPEDQVGRFREQFEKKKAERIAEQEKKELLFETDKNIELKRINDDGMKQVKAKEQLKSLNEKISKVKINISDLEAKIIEKEREYKGIPETPDMSGNENYQKVVSEIQKKQERLDGMDNNSAKRTELQKHRTELTCKLTENKILAEAQEKAEKEKSEKIAVLRKEQSEIGQKHADKQRELDLLKEFSIAKNQALAEKINPYFAHFKFKFLDYTKDGEPVEVCKMIVDGIDYMNGLNHSDQILCNIDLVAGLQEMNHLNLPIWVDDVESVNADRIPDVGRQMVLLKVSEGDLKVEAI